LYLVWVDFEPTRGREIQKRRPACVVSSNAYNRSTGFVVVCPITATICDNPACHTLVETKTKGQVITSQLRSMDVSKNSGRKIEFIERLPNEQFGMVIQKLLFIFDANSLFAS
jgi:mRNA interferase MazF